MNRATTTVLVAAAAPRSHLFKATKASCVNRMMRAAWLWNVCVWLRVW